MPLASSSITEVGDQSIQALGCGTVILKCKIGKEVFTHHLQDVLYAPKPSIIYYQSEDLMMPVESSELHRESVNYETNLIR
jgi:hypothetical protein